MLKWIYKTNLFFFFFTKSILTSLFFLLYRRYFSWISISNVNLLLLFWLLFIYLILSPDGGLNSLHTLAYIWIHLIFSCVWTRILFGYSLVLKYTHLDTWTCNHWVDGRIETITNWSYINNICIECSTEIDVLMRFCIILSNLKYYKRNLFHEKRCNPVKKNFLIQSDPLFSQVKIIYIYYCLL